MEMDETIQRSLGRIEGTLAAMDDKLDQAVDRFDLRMDSHSNRLRGVENKQHWYAGAAAIIGAGFGVVVNWFRNG